MCGTKLRAVTEISLVISLNSSCAIRIIKSLICLVQWFYVMFVFSKWKLEKHTSSFKVHFSDSRKLDDVMPNEVYVQL